MDWDMGGLGFQWLISRLIFVCVGVGACVVSLTSVKLPVLGQAPTRHECEIVYFW